MADARIDGATLVAIARASIHGELEGGIATRPDADWLRAPGATFVTLRREGSLRGCIGSLDAERPLGEDVERNARAAAFRDPRFPPLAKDELPGLGIEVSLLSPREAFAAASEDEAIARLRPGIDGLCLEYAHARATFLPQVWENIPDALAFLSHLRRKADLPERFWHPELRLSRYTVEKYGDEPARA